MAPGMARGWEVDFQVADKPLGKGILAVAFRDWSSMTVTILYSESACAGDVRSATKALVARLYEPSSLPLVHFKGA